MQSKIENYSGNILDQDTIKAVYQIEQDMWARENGLGEYIQCNNCETISSKEEVYDSLEHLIKKQTVARIEQILGLDSVQCPCCGLKNTKHVRGDNLYHEIKERFLLPKSFCTLMWDVKDEVSGFVFGYINTLEYIYDKELSMHFEKGIIPYITNKYNLTEGEEMITFSSMGTNESNMNMLRILPMVYEFFQYLPEYSDSLNGIVEVVTGSTMEKMYTKMQAVRQEIIVENPELLRMAAKKEIDILFQRRVVEFYKNNLTRDAKKVFHKCK